MNIIDHGEWVSYKPEHSPFPSTIDGMTLLFCRRVSDGRDWYEFQRKELTGTDSIYMTMMPVDHVVRTTTHDASALFPAGMRVIEVTGATEDHESFRQKKFDPKAKKFATHVPLKPVTLVDLIVKELGWDEETIHRKLDEANKHMPRKLRRPPNG